MGSVYFDWPYSYKEKSMGFFVQPVSCCMMYMYKYTKLIWKGAWMTGKGAWMTGKDVIHAYHNKLVHVHVHVQCSVFIL